MTKEELEKRAEVFAEKHAFRVPYDGSNRFYDDVDFKASKDGYLAGAEPREKQITVLSKHIIDLQKDKGNLTDKVRELEAQIEKMKCCQNCLHLCARCELGIDGCYVCSKWELRR